MGSQSGVTWVERGTVYHVSRRRGRLLKEGSCRMNLDQLVRKEDWNARCNRVTSNTFSLAAEALLKGERVKQGTEDASATCYGSTGYDKVQRKTSVIEMQLAVVRGMHPYWSWDGHAVFSVL